MVKEHGYKIDYEEIIKPYTYLKTQTQGKGFRNRLLGVFNIYYGLSEADLGVVQDFIDILHNSSLLVDDVEDDGTVRRGKMCAHRIFGIAHTINAGNLMYFKAWEKLMELGVQELSNIFVKSMVRLHIGQGTELCWRNASKCPSEEEYLQMVVGKTGELFSLGVRVMACLQESRCRRSDLEDSSNGGARVTEQLERYCEILGMIYQIRNDLENLEYDGVDAGAGVGLDRESFAHDLEEGKFSLPIIHYLEKRGLVNAGMRGEKDLTKFENRVELVRAIREYGGIQYSMDKIDELKQRGLHLCSTIGDDDLDTTIVELRQRLAGVLAVVCGEEVKK